MSAEQMPPRIESSHIGENTLANSYDGIMQRLQYERQEALDVCNDAEKAIADLERQLEAQQQQKKLAVAAIEFYDKELENLQRAKDDIARIGIDGLRRATLIETPSNTPEAQQRDEEAPHLQAVPDAVIDEADDSEVDPQIIRDDLRQSSVHDFAGTHTSIMNLIATSSTKGGKNGSLRRR